MLANSPLAYPFLGLLVGMVVGLTGVGGGSLMTPLLVLLFHIQPTKAVGTDLLYAAITKTVGTAVHSASATVDWRIVRRLAYGSIPGTALTLLGLYFFGPESKRVADVITFSLGIALLLTAICILFRSWIIDTLTARLGEPSERTASVLTTISGLVLGVLVSISSVGAGRAGRDRADPALSTHQAGHHRGVGHRARRAADPDRGAGPLADGRREHHPAGSIADRARFPAS